MEFIVFINGEEITINVDPQMPLLWFLREEMGLLGTKYSCGSGICGTCTVLVDGVARRSCTLPLENVAGAQITTIEGLGTETLHKVQEAFKKHNVVQCGYCMPGQVMTAAALFDQVEFPSKMDIENEMHNVLCRCGSYQRIKAALFELAGVK